MAGPKSAYKAVCKCQVDKLVRYQLWIIPGKNLSSAEYFKISAKTYQKYYYSSFFNQFYSSRKDLAENWGNGFLEEIKF